MKIKNMNIESLKKGGLVLVVGAVITGAITTNNILDKQENEKVPKDVTVRVEETTDDSRFHNDVITFVDEDNYMQGIINGKRGSETSIDSGTKYYVNSHELPGYELEVEVPYDEDEFSLVIDYDEKTISVKGLGKNK